jgi:hypothetical protein
MMQVHGRQGACAAVCARLVLWLPDREAWPGAAVDGPKAGRSGAARYREGKGSARPLMRPQVTSREQVRPLARRSRDATGEEIFSPVLAFSHGF